MKDKILSNILLIITILITITNVKVTPVDSPHFIIDQLKRYSSRVLREEFPILKSRLPSLWTRSYYCESIGHISKDAVKKYIEEQKGE